MSKQDSQAFILEGCNTDLDRMRINNGEDVGVLARLAYNLGFGFGTKDNSFSGGSMMPSMLEILYEQPEGTNLPLYKFESYEDQVCYIPYYNSEGSHYILKVTPNTAEIVFQDNILDFQPDGDVSLYQLGNDIYLTDGNSFPKLIETGIVYDTPIEDWQVSQIRRPGTFAPAFSSPDPDTDDLYHTVAYTLNQISDEYEGLVKVSSGTQYAYYYVYNNNQESRLSPYSNIIFPTTNIYEGTPFSLQLPVPEYETYLQDKPFVKAVVFVYRRGNTGDWNTIKRVPNDGSAEITANQSEFGYGTGITIAIEIADTDVLPFDPVPSDITELQEDSVPLLAETNWIAANLLVYGNYVQGYDNWTGLTLTATPVKKTNLTFLTSPDTANAAAEQLTFWPGGRYPLGVEILDKWGRRIGVVASIMVDIPDYELWHELIDDSTNPATIFGEDNTYWYRDAANNRYELDWTITGTLPSWAYSLRVVRGKDQLATSRYRTVARMYAWYKKVASDPTATEGDEGDVLFQTIIESVEDHLVILDDDDPDLTENYYFKGYAVELTMGEPFQYDTSTPLYVEIIGSADRMTGNTLVGYGRPYQIVKQTGGLYFFKSQYPVGQSSGGVFDYQNYSMGDGADPAGIQFSAFFDVAFYYKRTQPDPIYYQTEYGSIILAEDFVSGQTGTIQGDAYFTKFQKINQVLPQQYLYAINNSNSLSKESYSGRAYQIHGGAFSQNPIDLFNQDAQSTIGQVNIVNELQEQKTLETTILRSNPIVLGTQINGLNKFDSTNNEQMPVENGPIKCLVTSGATEQEPGVLLAIGTVGWESIYINATQITNVDGSITLQPNQASVTKPLSSHRPLLGQFGIQRLRNVCRTPNGPVYAWSNIAFDLVRYAQNGLSLLGKQFGFSRRLRTLKDNPAVYLNYNQIQDEIMLQGASTDAYIFSEVKKKWMGGAEYVLAEETPTYPTMGASLSNNQYYFLEGRVWITVPTDLSNNFFGQQKNPRLFIIVNKHYRYSKRPKQILVVGPKPLNVDIGTDAGTVTTVEGKRFEYDNYNGASHSVFTMNEGTGLYTGKPVFGRIVELQFEWDASVFTQLDIIDISFTLQDFQTKT